MKEKKSKRELEKRLTEEWNGMDWIGLDLGSYDFEWK